MGLFICPALFTCAICSAIGNIPYLLIDYFSHLFSACDIQSLVEDPQSPQTAVNVVQFQHSFSNMNVHSSTKKFNQSRCLSSEATATI